MQNTSEIRGVRLSADISADIVYAIENIRPDKVFFLFEENTRRHCQPLIRLPFGDEQTHILVLKPGEDNKNLGQVKDVWDFFEDNGASRSSLLITVGGGMLTDLGGFAACTFKRGMSFVNVPTTLLSMVDASVGGKTGINYNGLKNEIGVIHQPDEVIIWVPFLKTLDQDNLISGFAEMLKAGLIMDKSLWDDLKSISLINPDLDDLTNLIWRSVSVKNSIVNLDPDEAAERRSLNLGHTTAHAFESLSLKKGKHLHHGYAVAYGMMAESYLSEEICGLGADQAEEIRKVLRTIYGDIPFRKTDISRLINYMRSDKKNDNELLNFTLLEEIGKYSINNYTGPEKISEVLQRILTY